MKAKVYIKLLNETLVQYRNSRNSIERAALTSWHTFLLSISDRLLIIINNRHDIKQSVRTIISNRQSRFRNYQNHRFLLQSLINWSDDESTRDFSKFNFSRVYWTIRLNHSTLCGRMRISILNFSNNRNIAKSEININDLNMLFKATEVFDVTFQ